MEIPGHSRVLVGHAARVHGLKGELSVIWHADSPSLLSQLPGLWLLKKGHDPLWATVRSWREHKGRILLLLHEVQGKDQADFWRGADIYAERDHLPPPAEDEVFVFELPGLDVYLPDGSLLGAIAHVATEPTEVWTILTPGGKEVLFPAAEEFVTAIDPAAGRVDIAPPEGLLEIYLEE